MSTPPDQISKRISELESALAGESIRGTILILSGKIDDLLLDLLKRFLKSPRDKVDPLFRPLGPLGSFSSRIEMAYRLGLICREYADALDLLRKIRNDCAHTSGPFSIDAEPHCQRFVEFSNLTLKRDNLWIPVFGAICPQTTEHLAVLACICHILSMEETLSSIEATPDRFRKEGDKPKGTKESPDSAEGK